MAKGISVALVMLLITTITALAAPPPKTVETYILPATAQTLTVGQTLNLEAKTLKHGSHYTDVWQGATKEITVLNTETGEYESAATFTATEPGTFIITYTITMTAGKSHISFVGTGTVTVEVVAPALTLVGAAMYNVTATPRYNPQGNLTGYDAAGDVYAIMSDGSQVFYRRVNFNFSPNQTSRNLDVVIEGETFTIYNIIRP